MKNAYFTQLKSVKEQSFKDGTMAGIRLALNLVTIALSNRYGFGKQRIAELEKEVNALFNEMCDLNEPESTYQKMERRIKEIRGEDFKIEL